MAATDPIRISQLPVNKSRSENDILPVVDKIGRVTESISIGSIRETMDLSGAFNTVSDGVNAVLNNADFFVYTDPFKKELALKYKRSGSGAIVYTDENAIPIVYTTRKFQLSQPIQVSSYNDLRGLKFLRDKQRIELTLEINARVYNHGIFIVDLTDKTSVDDGGVNIVTASGVRMRRVMPDGNMHLVWFKSEVNTWDDAFDGLIKYRSLFTSSSGKTILPALRITLTRPVILPYFDKGAKCSWFLEGAGSAPENGTVLSFNIPRSVSLANGWDNTGAIDNWGSDFKFNSLTLSRLCIEGIATRVATTGDEASFAFCHGVKCRAKASLWEDVIIQNFRGCGLYLDNAFDNTFNRVGVFACGRMIDGKDYLNYDDIGNSANQVFAPVWVTSTRAGDNSNFLSWYGGSFELNNCTPFVKVDGGIQIHFTNVHSERPGRGSGMTGSLPVGTFAMVSGEVWFSQCGVSNFAESVRLGAYANVQINDCPRFSGGINLINPSTAGKVRLTIANSFIGSVYITGSIETDFRFVNTMFSNLRLPVVSGQIAVTNCQVSGNVDIVAGSGGILASSSGVRFVNCYIEGDVTGDSNSQRITLIGNHVRGSVTLGNGNNTVLGNTILGAVTVPPQPTNFVMGTHVQAPNPISIKASPSEIQGTIKKGQLAIAYEGTGNDQMWFCNTGGVGAAAKWSKITMA